MLGVLPGVIGVIQATEAIKIILGQGSSLSGRLLLYDAMDMKFREVRLRRDSSCPACGDNPAIAGVVEYEQFCGLPPTETGTQGDEELADYDITPRTLQAMRQANPELFLLDVREPYEIGICAIDGSVKIPLGQIAGRYREIPRDRDVVVHCKMGGRSAQAVEFLQSKGYGNVKNLAGGILRWIDDVDGSLDRY